MKCNDVDKSPVRFNVIFNSYINKNLLIRENRSKSAKARIKSPQYIY